MVWFGWEMEGGVGWELRLRFEAGYEGMARGHE